MIVIVPGFFYHGATSFMAFFVWFLAQSIKLCKDIPKEKVDDSLSDAAYTAFFSPVKEMREQFLMFKAKITIKRLKIEITL